MSTQDEPYGARDADGKPLQTQMLPLTIPYDEEVVFLTYCTQNDDGELSIHEASVVGSPELPTRARARLLRSLADTMELEAILEDDDDSAEDVDEDEDY